MKESKFISLKNLLKGPGARYLLSGASMTLLDLLLYQLFANVLKVSLFGVMPSISAVWIGTPIVITINFFISHYFVWKSTTSKRKTFVPFFGLNLFSGILLQSVVITLFIMAISVFVDNPGMNPIINLAAKCIAVFVGMIVNFFGSKFLFKWNKDWVTNNDVHAQGMQFALL